MASALTLFHPNVDAMKREGFWHARMLADGVDPNDLRETMDRITSWEGWCKEWCRTAEAHERRGEEALGRGRRLTAGDAFLRASLCYHFGQIIFFTDLDQKASAQGKKVAAYGKGMRHFYFPAERLEVPFQGVTLPGYLRLPRNGGKGPFPCLICFGGLDSTKEDFYPFENLCLERGLATFTFDGPGQGETWARRKMGEGFEAAVSAVLDFLERRPEVDARRLGILGRSMGGYFAPRAAALDPRVRACVSFGGTYDLSHWAEIERRALEGNFHFEVLVTSFMHTYGVDDLSAMARIARGITLDDVIESLRCPLLVVHGKRDEILPPSQAQKLFDRARGPKGLSIGEECVHCCHNRHYQCRPLMADWAAGILR